MLKYFLNEFKTYIPLQLPQLMDLNRMGAPNIYDDCILLEFSLAEPYELEEVMDILEDDIELVILYHHIPSTLNRFGHSTCAYSNPSFGQMFKVNARTEKDGLVHNISVIIYDSLEVMCGSLQLDLKLHSQTGHYKYQRKEEDVLMDFL